MDVSKILIAESADVKTALEKIDIAATGIIFVHDETGRMTGILSDGDIRRAIDKSNYFFDMTAQDFMSKNFISVNPNDLASECLKIMAEKKIGCLAVMEDKTLVGIINQKDLVKLGI